MTHLVGSTYLLRVPLLAHVRGRQHVGYVGLAGAQHLRREEGRRGMRVCPAVQVFSIPGRRLTAQTADRGDNLAHRYGGHYRQYAGVIPIVVQCRCFAACEPVHDIGVLALVFTLARMLWVHNALAVRASRVRWLLVGRAIAHARVGEVLTQVPRQRARALQQQLLVVWLKQVRLLSSHALRYRSGMQRGCLGSRMGAGGALCGVHVALADRRIEWRSSEREAAAGSCAWRSRNPGPALRPAACQSSYAASPHTLPVLHQLLAECTLLGAGVLANKVCHAGQVEVCHAPALHADQFAHSSKQHAGVLSCEFGPRAHGSRSLLSLHDRSPHNSLRHAL